MSQPRRDTTAGARLFRRGLRYTNDVEKESDFVGHGRPGFAHGAAMGKLTWTFF